MRAICIAYAIRIQGIYWYIDIGPYAIQSGATYPMI